ncbi:LysR family transcriptional regulator [Parvibium lacunae]|uniref:LysR family transcriptional regulator n=1 Tax=Parvibium lacunae TaxID=1888893 RepID=A0A368L0S6_9BURK|nr:LysR family transcriptional regulator [Parvibium lacunae]RCS57158.1 LysR family transcriptional regulator [Parvibium lacunae]
MKPLDVLTLRLIVQTADSGSFTAAAEKSHLVLAAVSKRIQEAEQSLGIKLFTRQSRGVIPTPAGHVIIKHARTILDSLYRLGTDAQAFTAGLQGIVRIAANTSAVCGYLPEEFAQFVVTNKNVQIDLDEVTSESVVNGIVAGQYDIGIIGENEPHPGLETFRYRADFLSAVLPVAHPFAKHAQISFTVLQQETFIGLEIGSSIHKLIRNHLGSQINLRMHVRSFDAMCRMVQAGLGVGILPTHMALKHAASMSVCVLPLSDEWAARHLLACCTSTAALSAAASTFWQQLKAGVCLHD